MTQTEEMLVAHGFPAPKTRDELATENIALRREADDLRREVQRLELYALQLRFLSPAAMRHALGLVGESSALIDQDAAAESFFGAGHP